MLDEAVANQIESLPFHQFRDLARHCIENRGYGRPTTSDGWSDGGRDLRLYRTGGLTPVSLAVQVSVEWEWKAKLWEDVCKAKDKLQCYTFIYVTNRRIGDAEFQPLVLRALAGGVHISKLDKQDLASQINGDNQLSLWFADFMDYPQPSPNREPVSLREEVASAYILFSEHASAFRERMVERAIIVQLAHANTMARPELIDAAASLLHFPEGNARKAFDSAIDRLLVRSIITSNKKQLALSKEEKSRHVVAQRMIGYEWDLLVKEIEKLVKQHLPRKANPKDAALEVANSIGRVVHAYRDYQATLLQGEKLELAIKDKYQKEVNNVRALLHQEGVQLSKIDDCMKELAELESRHPIVTRLTAGEVFRKLANTGPSVLLKAMAKTQAVQLYLEPSVMIPLLCTKLFSEVRNPIAKGGLLLYEGARALRFRMELPDVYLEECATHLVMAGRYERLLDTTPPKDLQYSENAFVSYYACLNDKALKFRTFLSSFGFEWSTIEFHRHRDKIEVFLESLAHRYGIGISRMNRKRVPEKVRKGAQEDLMQVFHDQGVNKPHLLEVHDVIALQCIRAEALLGKNAQLLVTWDKSMIAACQNDHFDWWCLDPVHAADLLALVNSKGPNAVGVEVSLHLGDIELQRASLVWDTLVGLERDRMRDADLLALATAFKEAFLEKQSGDAVVTAQIKAAWEKWKEEFGERHEGHRGKTSRKKV